MVFKLLKLQGLPPYCDRGSIFLTLHFEKKDKKMTMRGRNLWINLWLTIVSCCLCLCPFRFANSASKTITIKAPPHVRFMIDERPVPALYKDGRYFISLSDLDKGGGGLRARGPMGGIAFSPFQGVQRFTFTEGVVREKAANPALLSVLPKLCPRIVVKAGPTGPLVDQRALEFLYQGADDRLNHVPSVQLTDPDYFQGVQYKTSSEMDGRNVLLLKKVTVRNDYEDTAILDYEGPHPLTGKPHRVFEGDGGFYANFHYAIFPYRRLKHLDRQEWLHLAQGKLKDINKESLRPLLRAHSFIPGPFLSREDYVYNLCEWGDTRWQAPEQTLHYENMALWDWDYSIERADHVLMVVWEGDEEDWMYQAKLIDPFYLTDDMVAIFEIRREDTLRPLTLVNESKDFEVVIETGQLFPVNNSLGKSSSGKNSL